MDTIALYRRYLYNSLNGKDGAYKSRRLLAEKQKISDIVNGIDTCFYGDKALKDKTDKSIYTYIKREIIRKMANNESLMDLVAFESKYYLAGLLNEIDQISVSLNV